MPISRTEQARDLYLTLSSLPAGAEESLRNRGTLTASGESADDDRVAICSTRCGLPIW